MKKIFNKLKKNNIKAIKNNDVPVSCVIIKNNAIISASYNKKNKKNNPLCHAEINAIIKAARITKSWNLNDCDLYVTLEPCEMCKRVIEEARIKNVYYILNNDKKDIAVIGTSERVLEASVFRPRRRAVVKKETSKINRSSVNKKKIVKEVKKSEVKEEGEKKGNVGRISLLI